MVQQEITSIKQTLKTLLSSDLSFHGEDTGYASHDLHSFPAKFPPQIPSVFIDALTDSGDSVLDPMMGSGTTLVEATIRSRRAIGIDIDPLARMIARAKTTWVDIDLLRNTGSAILKQVRTRSQSKSKAVLVDFLAQMDKRSRAFVDYWFASETQQELAALINAIKRVENTSLRLHLTVIFSSIIITKSGGVSMAFDLAHTRPHRAKMVYDRSGELLLGHEWISSDSPRVKLLTKTLRSPFNEFEKKLLKILPSIASIPDHVYEPSIQPGDAQSLALPDESIDLIVTSPPYISNAIDYMRAHKFALVWLGYSIPELGMLRRDYIGGEAITDFQLLEVPSEVQGIPTKLLYLDEKKSAVVHRYYSEMTKTLGEMYRVLKPGKAAILVVGTSIIKGVDTEIGECLRAIGENTGFEVAGIGIRQLDRDKRMLPAGKNGVHTSQIEQRMHEEYVIGFWKRGQS